MTFVVNIPKALQADAAARMAVAPLKLSRLGRAGSKDRSGHGSASSGKTGADRATIGKVRHDALNWRQYTLLVSNALRRYGTFGQRRPCESFSPAVGSRPANRDYTEDKE